MQLSKPDPTVPTGMVEYRDPTTSPSCFVAGTLVHTKDGLKPIEQIKVGDYVLSKPDSGVGEQEYKRVTETFVRDGQDIWLVQYIVSGEKTSRALVVTGNHPIWKEHVGWTTVNNLKGGDGLRLHCNDNDAWVFRVISVYETDTPDVGWAGGRNTNGIDYGDGPTVDLREGGGKVNQLPEDSVCDDVGGLLRRQVFNIEVEDFHTYYVGEAGVWVHNVCPNIYGDTSIATH